jgi:hypothetical protein
MTMESSYRTTMVPSLNVSLVSQSQPRPLVLCHRYRTISSIANPVSSTERPVHVLEVEEERMHSVPLEGLPTFQNIRRFVEVGRTQRSAVRVPYPCRTSKYVKLGIEDTLK